MPLLQLFAIEEVAGGVAHAEEQMHGAARGIAADETGQRADPRTSANEDHRRRACGKTEPRIGLEEGERRLPRLQLRELA